MKMHLLGGNDGLRERTEGAPFPPVSDTNICHLPPGEGFIILHVLTVWGNIL